MTAMIAAYSDNGLRNGGVKNLILSDGGGDGEVEVAVGCGSGGSEG